MTTEQAIAEARKMVINGIRGIGTMTLHTASGKKYGILSDSTLVDREGNPVDVADVTEEFDSVSSTTDANGGIFADHYFGRD